MSSLWSSEPVWNPKEPLVPFKDNVMQTYGRYGNLEWRPLPNFEAQMAIVDYERGMRAAVYILEDMNTGIRYPLQFSAMFDLVTKSRVIEGLTTFEEWQAVKRGANYSIKPVL